MRPSLLADVASGMPGDGIPTPILLMIGAVGLVALTFVLLAIYVSIRPPKK